MARMEITPNMMVSIANDIRSKKEEWDNCVKQIYQLHSEMNAMWEGEANDAFNVLFEEDRQKFLKLSAMMVEYQEAIITMANNYTESENAAKTIVSRR